MKSLYRVLLWCFKTGLTDTGSVCICKCIWEVLSCGICGMHTLEFPSQRLIPVSLLKSRKNEDCNDHEACDIKKQVFAMDPKQRERSAPQSNFILEITGFGKAATKAKCLECCCRHDIPKPIITCCCLCMLVFWLHFELDVWIKKFDFKWRHQHLNQVTCSKMENPKSLKGYSAIKSVMKRLWR